MFSKHMEDGQAHLRRSICKGQIDMILTFHVLTDRILPELF